ncbi:hypothetical protein NGB19_06950 [Staphylococcus equorum]|uniref:hypothetical protein n=1 Tax=Staphylococcus equorum TaxID=246432 RepID=UPI002DB961CE|nr:hypothetical protein [Staphylococcus equorum]MEB7746528.1 hypothetical protein [Staphylococcus equorum]
MYTPQALNDVIDEYKSKEYNKHIEELDCYDSYSNSLLSKANMLVDKLKNSLFRAFTGSNPDAQELNSILKQAENNVNYARALTHLHAMLISKIESNESIEAKMEELKQII